MPAGRRRNAISALGNLGDLDNLHSAVTRRGTATNEAAVSRFRQLSESGAEVFSFDRADEFAGQHFDFVIRSKLEPFSPFSESHDDPLSDIADFTVSAARVCARYGRTLVVPHCYAFEEEKPFSCGRLLSFHMIGKRQGQMHFKEGDLKNLVVLDDAGYSGWSSLASPAGFDQFRGTTPDMHWLRHHASEIRSSNVSKYSQAARDGCVQTLPDHFVFVALQKLNDRTQEHAFVGMLTMLDLVVARFDGSGIKVVVKPHPKCNSAAPKEKLRSLGEKIVVSQHSIHEILPRCKALFTINSGVGSEALIYHLPIYVFGLSEYRWCAHEVRSSDELHHKTQELARATSIEEMDRFLYFYRRIKQIDVRDIADMERRIEEVFVQGDLGILDVQG